MPPKFIGDYREQFVPAHYFESSSYEYYEWHHSAHGVPWRNATAVILFERMLHDGWEIWLNYEKLIVLRRHR